MKTKFFKTTTLKQALKMGPRRFVKDYLFPAMRREHGNGFAMSTWHSTLTEENRDRGVDGFDGLYDRKAPACGSVMCVGGTMQQVIEGGPSRDQLAQVLGFPTFATGDPVDILFYDWQDNRGPWEALSIPFNEADTPAKKERIAEKAVLAAIKIGEQKRSAR